MRKTVFTIAVLSLVSLTSSGAALADDFACSNADVNGRIRVWRH